MGITAPFGRLLRALRQSRRLTIEELAEASGVSGRAIGDMERGRSRRPHRGTITALAQGLDLDEAAHADLLAAARAARPGARPAEPVRASHHTLPRGVRDFVGRQAELTELRALAREAAEGAAVAPPVAVVSGPPGSAGAGPGGEIRQWARRGEGGLSRGAGPPVGPSAKDRLPHAPDEVAEPHAPHAFQASAIRPFPGLPGAAPATRRPCRSLARQGTRRVRNRARSNQRPCR
ncbi:helix-turn-helix domain-containing protein [Streptomyces sp. NPDC056373]|uniref:helix-turn-helix domain-containing protein n=1 Tax=Streptomyces sp. NPDC056373 TaxID=3345798 RepID=UPI0035D9F8F7